MSIRVTLGSVDNRLVIYRGNLNSRLVFNVRCEAQADARKSPEVIRATGIKGGGA